MNQNEKREILSVLSLILLGVRMRKKTLLYFLGYYWDSEWEMSKTLFYSTFCDIIGIQNEKWAKPYCTLLSVILLGFRMRKEENLLVLFMILLEFRMRREKIPIFSISPVQLFQSEVPPLLKELIGLKNWSWLSADE